MAGEEGMGHMGLLILQSLPPLIHAYWILATASVLLTLSPPWVPVPQAFRWGIGGPKSLQAKYLGEEPYPFNSLLVISLCTMHGIRLPVSLDSLLPSRTLNMSSA